MSALRYWWGIDLRGVPNGQDIIDRSYPLRLGPVAEEFERVEAVVHEFTGSTDELLRLHRAWKRAVARYERRRRASVWMEEYCQRMMHQHPGTTYRVNTSVLWRLSFPGRIPRRKSNVWYNDLALSEAEAFTTAERLRYRYEQRKRAVRGLPPRLVTNRVRADRATNA